MPAIVTSTEVERAAAEVFASATDPAPFSEWQQGVVDSHMNGRANLAGSPTVGSKCVTTRRVGGANRPGRCQLVRMDPPRTWSVRGMDGPIRAAVDVLLEPVTDSRSRLAITVGFTGHGIGKILVPLMVRPRQVRRCQPTCDTQAETGSWEVHRSALIRPPVVRAGRCSAAAALHGMEAPACGRLVSARPTGRRGQCDAALRHALRAAGGGPRGVPPRRGGAPGPSPRRVWGCEGWPSC
jgi:hypothetical protein